jgi:hypothetical protein
MGTVLARVLAAVVSVIAVTGSVGTLPAAASTTPCASVSVADVDQPEGTGTGHTVFDFTVSVVADPGCAVTGSVDFHTQDGDPAANGAVAPSDYQATSGTLTWSGDAGSRTIAVPVAWDSVAEPNEQFWVVLDHPVGLTVTGGSAAGGILNDDPPLPTPTTVSADGTPKCWSSSAVCLIGVHAAGTGSTASTVRWRTLDDGGQGLGYVPVKDAVLTIPAGATRADVVVRLVPNANMRQFQFGVQIYSPSSGVLGNATALVTVTDGGQ